MKSPYLNLVVGIVCGIAALLPGGTPSGNAALGAASLANFALFFWIRRESK